MGERTQDALDDAMAEVEDLRTRAGQCRACRTMGGQDVRCDACADSGMVAEVGRLREEYRLLERACYAAGADIAWESEDGATVGVTVSLRVKTAEARRAALLEVAGMADVAEDAAAKSHAGPRACGALGDLADDIRALAGDQP